MRGLAVLAVGFVVGCVTRGGEPPDEPPIIIGNPQPGGGCHDDSTCKGLVCARTGVCLSADQIRAVHVSWTVSGMPASQTSCASAPDLEIELDSPSGSGGRLAFVPVPCIEGKFSVDKAPISIDHVSLGRSYGGGWQTAKIDAITGEASLDLPY
jgi:hypothetical protein